MLLYLFLLLSFLQVGFFGLSGDAGAQAVLEHELVTLHRWLTPQQLADLMVFGRVLPGGVPLSAASLTGCMAAAARFGFLGSVCASLVAVVGLVVPATVWTAVVTRWQKSPLQRDMLRCVEVLLRPLIPGLIAGAALLMMHTETFGPVTGDTWQLTVSTVLFLATLIGVGRYRIHAGFMIVLCGLLGWLLL